MNDIDRLAKCPDGFDDCPTEKDKPGTVVAMIAVAVVVQGRTVEKMGLIDHQNRATEPWQVGIENAARVALVSNRNREFNVGITQFCISRQQLRIMRQNELNIVAQICQSPCQSCRHIG